MKRMIAWLALAAAITAQAQIVNVVSVERLSMPAENDRVAQAVAISPQGDYLLISSDTKQGLVKWDLQSGSSSVITDEAGAGSDVRISPDGKQILYTQVSYKDKRKHQALKSINLDNGKTKTLQKATRNLQGFEIDNGTAAVVTDGQMKLQAISGKATEINRPVLSRKHLQLFITRDGKTTLLAPNGENERYIWGSLSPDTTRVLYYVSGKGAFVCDIDGSNVIAMGNLTAPKWWDNRTIVGMDEIDGEYAIEASQLVMRTLDGQMQTLTGDDVIATYPQPCSAAGTIAFSTPDGQIYLIKVK